MTQSLSFVTGTGLDRRRLRRDRVERLLERADHLSREDRLLIEQVYRHGIAVSDIGRLSGKPARTLRRRITVLVQRMNSPLFEFVVSHSDLLPTGMRRTAELVVLRGHSLRRASTLSGQSLHHVRLHMRSLYVLARL